MKVPVTNEFLWPNYGKNRSFHPKKHLAYESKNHGDSPAKMHLKGVHTQLDYFKPERTATEHFPENAQPYTFRTLKWGWDGLPKFTDQQLYDAIRSMIYQFGWTKKSMITDEYPENAQGFDPTIYERMYFAYKGALDKFRETEPNLSVRDTGLFGSYGIDDFMNLVNRFWLYGNYQTALEALTTHVHHGPNLSSGGWGGDVSFYVSRQFEVRNVNVSYYMYHGNRFIPYELLFHNERIKVGTKTYQNQDREVDWIVFTTPDIQSLVIGTDGSQAGIEEAREGDLLQFPNGVIEAFNGPAMAGEYRTLGYWATIICRGVLVWGESSRGRDWSKLGHHNRAVGHVNWTPTGGSTETYVPGQNGAPQRDEDQGVCSRQGTCSDSLYAGYEKALEYEGFTDTLYFANYTSSLGSFTAQPGAAGLHLNGFGPLNMGLMCMKHALDQRKGIALIGIGPSGRSAHYYNGFLSQHEFEDNVTLTYAGQSINLGRVYGRQTVTKKF